MVSKVFEKLFLDFQYGSTSSRRTADLLTDVSDRIAGDFNRSGATRALALAVSKTFDRIGMLVLFTSLRVLEFQVRYFISVRPFSVSDVLKWLWM